ncbi:MAG: MoaD/ThiS family protein [Bdellovibrionales bacterium]|jgi:molybdopterin converting factor subunit 1|nr:MoaD/ThiS family protein [Bdellovibrionales bacterium]
MKVNIMYFAAMREQAGKSEEIAETNAITPDQLFDEVYKKYNFSISKKNLKVAINDNYSSFQTKLSENDTVVFIPPVAGG